MSIFQSTSNFSADSVLNKELETLLNDQPDEKLIYHLSTYNKQELCIFCQTLYRLKLKVESHKVLDYITECLIQEGGSSKTVSPSYLLTVVKYFRQIGYKNEKFLLYVSRYIDDHHEKFTKNFTLCSHYLTLYANFKMFDQKVFDILAVQGGLKLMESSTENMRLKDLARLLWCVGTFGTEDKIVPHMIDAALSKLEVLSDDEFIQFPHQLLDCISSCIMMNCYPVQLIENTFSSSTILKAIKSSKRAKIHRMLLFILESIGIEAPQIEIKNRCTLNSLCDRHQIDEAKELMRRPLMRTEFESQLKNCGPLKPIIYYPLPHINIASIGFNDQVIEVVDDSIAISLLKKESDSKDEFYGYSGLFKTKIRQLNVKGIRPLILEPRLNNINYDR